MGEDESSLSRRGFLTGAGAAAAVGAGVVATGGMAAAQGDGSGSGNGGGGGGGGNAETQVGGEGAQGDGAGSNAPRRYDSILDAPESWQQPWVFRPNGDNELQLTVVEHQNNLLFSYMGSTPGPTIRMDGDQTLKVHLVNTLGLDAGLSTVQASPSPSHIPGPEGAMIKALSKNDPTGIYGGTPDDPVLNKIPTDFQPDWCLGEHVNGVHTAHVTNMHTHGLHVSPQRNPDGTHSDNIYLRLVPQADYDQMQQDPENCLERWQEALERKKGEILPHEARYEFRLGNTAWTPVHPPGTHWYHPHSHGSTHTQVSSGMAGFLIIEGDVDEALNRQLAGDPDANPDARTGLWDYRERTMFAQRIIVNQVTSDPDADRTNLFPKQGSRFVNSTNGSTEPNVIVMRPGAIERWRILNGSVDGSGFLRVMVLEGRFEEEGTGAKASLHRVLDGTTSQLVTEDEPGGKLIFTDADKKTTSEQLIDLKQNLFQVSWDGVTLVEETSPGVGEYIIRPLADVNGGMDPDFADKLACTDGQHAVLCYERPNELALSPANRADVLWQAPPLSDPAQPMQYTVIGLPTQLHGSKKIPASGFQILAHVVVRGDQAGDGQTIDLANLDLPPVPDYLQPIADAELEITDAERAARPDLDGTYRTRTVSYAGWGSPGFPRIDVPAEIADANPEVNKLSYYRPPPPDTSGLMVPDGARPRPIEDLQAYGTDEISIRALAPNLRTMSVDGHKFEPGNSLETTGTEPPRMLLDTAEEWAVANESIECYSIPLDYGKVNVTEELAAANAADATWYTYFDPGFGQRSRSFIWGNPTAYAVRPADIADINDTRQAAGRLPLDADNIQAGAADHPFHIHQNPFWLIRLEVPNNDGELVNVLPKPRWADVSYLPRNGGRAIFRSRFADYTGEFVDHCHILLHEDNGMMQRVEVVDDAGETNYVGRDSVASADGEQQAIDDTYRPKTLDEMWVACATFIDGNNSGQHFPVEGWVPDPPHPTREV